MGKLGQLLVARGWITIQQLTRALQNQNSVGGRLGTCLLEMEVLGEDLLARSLSEQLGVPAAVIEDLRGIPDEVLRLIPEKLARRCRAIPFRLAGGRLDVATQDPRNLVCQDEIAFACGRRVKVHVLHELRIFEALQRYYGEECPSRYTLLLDRLNRARYLWGTRDDAAGGQARPGGGQGSPGPSPGVHAGSAEERMEVLSALPPEGLLAGPPRFAPPPLPEPSLPSQPRRRSLFRSRGAGAPSPPPPDDRAGGGADRQVEQAGTMLPPLEELDFRAQPRRAAAAEAAAEAAPAAGAAPGGAAPAEPPALTGAAPPAVTAAEPPAMKEAEVEAPQAAMAAPDAGAEREPPAGAEAEPPAVAKREPHAGAAAEPHAGAAPEPPPTDLEATVPLGPPQAQPPRRAAPAPPAARAQATSAAPAPEAAEAAELRGPHEPPGAPGAFGHPRRKVALSDAERAELGLAAAPPATAPTAPAEEAPATLEAVEEAFAGTTDREEVGRILLGFLAQSFRRVALFRTNRGQITAWMARGDGIDQEAFARYTASFKEPSVFLNLRQGSGIHIGPLPPMAAHRELALCWGGGLPRDCVVLPVRLRDRLVSVIYVDGGSRGLAAVDLDRMNRLTAATAAAFERCILHKKFGYPQS